MHAMQLSVRLIFTALLVASICAPRPAVAADTSAVPILLSADTDGHTTPCQTCPTGAGDGGIARRAAVLRGERGEALLLDAGSTFFGVDSAASHGGVIVAAYNAMGYDAVNLSYRDFREGLTAARATLQDAKFAVLSANLVDATTGRPVFKPYVIKTIAGQKVAILGVTESPPGIDQLPHLQQQLAGLLIRPVAEALADWLPKARRLADRVVLLYYGTAEGLTAVQARFGSDLDAIAVGGIRPDDLPASAHPPVLASDEHGKSLAKLTADGANTQIPIGRGLPEDAEMTRLVATFR